MISEEENDESIYQIQNRKNLVNKLYEMTYYPNVTKAVKNNILKVINNITTIMLEQQDPSIYEFSEDSSIDSDTGENIYQL